MNSSDMLYNLFFTKCCLLHNSLSFCSTLSKQYNLTPPPDEIKVNQIEQQQNFVPGTQYLQVCGYSVQNLFHGSLLVPRILTLLLRFWKHLYPCCKCYYIQPLFNTHLFYTFLLKHILWMATHLDTCRRVQISQCIIKLGGCRLTENYVNHPALAVQFRSQIRVPIS